MCRLLKIFALLQNSDDEISLAIDEIGDPIRKDLEVLSNALRSMSQGFMQLSRRLEEASYQAARIANGH